MYSNSAWVSRGCTVQLPLHYIKRSGQTMYMYKVIYVMPTVTGARLRCSLAKASLDGVEETLPPLPLS